jgi:hypothetical protein
MTSDLILSFVSLRGELCVCGELALSVLCEELSFDFLQVQVSCRHHSRRNFTKINTCGLLLLRSSDTLA